MRTGLAEIYVARIKILDNYDRYLGLETEWILGVYDHDQSCVSENGQEKTE